MYAFGVGAIMDFPNVSAIVSGLDDWFVKDRSNPVNEERLLAAIKNRIGHHINYIYKPPVVPNEDRFSFEGRLTGVPVRAFPRWLRCPICFRMAQVDDGCVRFIPDFYRSDKIRFVHKLCPKAKKPPTMVPVRRLIACEKGHIDDFPWMYFVHGGETDCKGPLYWKEWGVSGAIDDIRIELDGGPDPGCPITYDVYFGPKAPNGQGPVGRLWNAAEHPFGKVLIRPCPQDIRCRLQQAADLHWKDKKIQVTENVFQGIPKLFIERIVRLSFHNLS